MKSADRKAFYAKSNTVTFTPPDNDWTITLRPLDRAAGAQPAPQRQAASPSRTRQPLLLKKMHHLRQGAHVTSQPAGQAHDAIKELKNLA